MSQLVGCDVDNTVFWRCSAYDLDISDRIVFEDNTIICTEQGVVPHGNSVSGYVGMRLNPYKQTIIFALSLNSFSF